MERVGSFKVVPEGDPRVGAAVFAVIRHGWAPVGFRIMSLQNV